MHAQPQALVRRGYLLAIHRLHNKITSDLGLVLIQDWTRGGPVLTHAVQVNTGPDPESALVQACVSALVQA